PMLRNARFTARPIAAFARLPGPSTLPSTFMPSSATMGPLTITIGHADPVVVATPIRLNSGAASALTAAPTTGRYAGRQPAITALIAMSRQVAASNAG